jgi:hypothetical protein
MVGPDGFALADDPRPPVDVLSIAAHIAYVFRRAGTWDWSWSPTLWEVKDVKAK